MTKLVGYLGVDQYGQKFTIKKHPRKELMELLGASHAVKMYVDAGGRSKHIGYVVASHWVQVFEVREWKDLYWDAADSEVTS